MHRRLWRLLRNMKCWRLPSPGGVAALGDSVTGGRSSPRYGFLARDSWLSWVICDRGIPYCFNAGVSDQTTEEIAARVDDVIARRPDVVVILAGTNDVYYGHELSRPMRLLEQMADHFAAAGIAVIFATLPPYDDFPDAVAAFNAELERLVAHRGARLIDFYGALADGGRYRDGLSDDRLHPNARGARVMGEAAKPVLRAALASRRGEARASPPTRRWSLRTPWSLRKRW